MKWRPWLTWLALGITGITAGMTYLDDDEKGSLAAPAKVGAAPRQSAAVEQRLHEQQAPAASHIELERLKQQNAKGGRNAAVANAFNSKSWYVAPPPPPPPPPPVPTAPPLPFTYLGRYEDQPAVVVVLAKGDRVYTVAEGEVIDGTYRVDQITDDAVHLVYLPMNINQSLSTQAAPENNQPRNGFAERYRRP